METTGQPGNVEGLLSWTFTSKISDRVSESQLPKKAIIGDECVWHSGVTVEQDGGAECSAVNAYYFLIYRNILYII